MEKEIEATIEELKVRMGAKTDADLARRLRIDKSTISSWKSRGRIPERFTKLLSETLHEFAANPPEIWGKLERAAFKLALLRFTIAFQNVARSRDYELIMQSFSDADRFWVIMSQAQEDLLAHQKGGQLDFATSFAVLLHKDAEDAAETGKRVLVRLNNHYRSAVAEERRLADQR